MLRRLLPAALVAVVGLGLVACNSSDSTSPARYDLTMNLMGMAPHIGQGFYLRVWHADTGVEIDRTWVIPVVQSDFTVVVPDILIAGEVYYVDFWADLNGNGRYDSPPVDHTWRRVIGPVAGPTPLMFMHDTNWVDVGWPDP